MEGELKRKLIFCPSSSVILFFFFSALLTGAHVVQVAAGSSSDHHHHHRHLSNNDHHDRSLSKLFVFGDSYADTGNSQKAMANSWKVPYGVTFPGKSSGRFSDGRVFPDYLASYVGIKSPLPYRWREYGKNRIGYGMNFAFGGTGVFDTLVPEPNMTTQIKFLKQLLTDGVYTKQDLSTSIAYISLAGNDYSTYNVKNGSSEGLPAFITRVINQLRINVREIHSMGVKKIAVSTLPPIGCLPVNTATSSFQKCNKTTNTAVGFHNLLLQKMVQKLNNKTEDSPFMIVDLFNAFMSVFNKRDPFLPSGNLKFENPLKPCCVGISSEYKCGSVDENGVKKYSVCDKPFDAFFWDQVHPTQQGWHAVYSALKSSLHQLYL